MLKILSVKFKWPSSAELHYNIEVSRGEIVTLEGPSGVGKSTLIDLISGFIHPLSGQIKWLDKDITYLHPSKRPIATIFQNDNLFDHLTCEFNASLGISPSGSLSKYNQQRLDKIFSELGILDLKSRYPNQISGGQQARVSLARSLLSEKPIFLLDEPVSSLDQQTRTETLKVLKNTVKSHEITLVVVSHHDDDRKLLEARPIEIK